MSNRAYDFLFTLSIKSVKVVKQHHINQPSGYATGPQQCLTALLVQTEAAGLVALEVGVVDGEVSLRHQNRYCMDRAACHHLQPRSCQWDSLQSQTPYHSLLMFQGRSGFDGVDHSCWMMSTFD
jgi:hypothetical protein